MGNIEDLVNVYERQQERQFEFEEDDFLKKESCYEKYAVPLIGETVKMLEFIKIGDTYRNDKR